MRNRIIFAYLLMVSCAGFAASQPTCSQKCDPDGSKCVPVCPPSGCNAQARAIGGQTMVLDAFSLIPPQESWAYFPPGPGDCCAQCGDTDNCNAYSFCNSPAGCGSGCAAHVSQNPGTVDIMTPRPLLRFGPYKSCLGDKWPAYTCRLLRINNTSSPPFRSQTADGWVSGVVPKPVQAGCARGVSQLTCSTCRATKDPATCLNCTATANRQTGVYACAVCANINDPAAKAACVRCTAPGRGQRPALCHDCMSYENPAANMTAIEKCFTCVTKATTGKGSECPACFQTLPANKQQACTSCVQRSSSPLQGLGCSLCSAPGVNNSTRCRACVSKQTSQEGVMACSSCLQRRLVQPQWAQACIDCTTKAGSPAAIPGCYSLDPKGSPLRNNTASTAVVRAYYGCLASAKTQEAGIACHLCFKGGVAGRVDTAGCYKCATSMQDRTKAQFCPECWTTAKKAQAGTCQTCLASVPPGVDPSVCWMGARALTTQA